MTEQERKAAERKALFAEIQAGPNPLTDDEITKLAAKDPARWAEFVKKTES